MIKETSALAYHDIKKSLPQRQYEVFCAIEYLSINQRTSGATIKEIAIRIGKPDNEITGRLNELQNLGLIRTCHVKRKCKINGRTKEEWKINDKKNDLFS